MTAKDKLGRYREKRDFGRTGEPRSGRPTSTEPNSVSTGRSLEEIAADEGSEPD